MFLRFVPISSHSPLCLKTRPSRSSFLYRPPPPPDISLPVWRHLQPPLRHSVYPSSPPPSTVSRALRQDFHKEAPFFGVSGNTGLIFLFSTSTCSDPNLVKFADDAAVVGFISGNDAQRRETLLLLDWRSRNILALDVTKTQELLVDFQRVEICGG